MKRNRFFVQAAHRAAGVLAVVLTFGVLFTVSCQEKQKQAVDGAVATDQVVVKAPAMSFKQVTNVDGLLIEKASKLFTKEEVQAYIKTKAAWMSWDKLTFTEWSDLSSIPFSNRKKGEFFRLTIADFDSIAYYWNDGSDMWMISEPN
ncbi:hypothetical protein AGMMS50267_13710 [Spirochaetia bacterium]|nr:hypothetical protein AGMMS50267_13710 [Spirochaetia bacterium]